MSQSSRKTKSIKTNPQITHMFELAVTVDKDVKVVIIIYTQ